MNSDGEPLKYATKSTVHNFIFLLLEVKNLCYAASTFSLFLATASYMIQTSFKYSCPLAILKYQGRRSSERHPQLSNCTPCQVDVLVRPEYIWMRHCHYSMHHDHLHSEQGVLILALEDFL